MVSRYAKVHCPDRYRTHQADFLARKPLRFFIKILKISVVASHKTVKILLISEHQKNRLLTHFSLYALAHVMGIR